MPRDRLPTSIWVSAALRKVNSAGGFGAVIKKGEPDSGTILLRINLLNSESLLLSESRDLDGALTWRGPLGDEAIKDAKIDDYIERAMSRDPDIWVVEIEDKQGANPFTS